MPIRIPRDDLPASTGGLLRPALTLFAVLSLVTGLLYPLAVKGVPYRALGAATLLPRNLLIYGLGGVLVPFVGIKLIDLVLSASGLV